MILSSSPDLKGVGFSGLGEALEALEKAREPVLIAMEGLWERSSEVLGFVRSRGLNPFALDLLDLRAERELAKGAFSIATIARARHARLLSSPASHAPLKFSLERRVSRRELIARPFAALTYYNVPMIDGDACNVLDKCDLCVKSCPYKALEGKPPEVNYDRCTMCGLCLALCPIGAYSTPTVSEEALESYLREIRGESSSPAYIVISQLDKLREIDASPSPTLVLPVAQVEEVSPLLLLMLYSRGLKPVLFAEKVGEVSQFLEELSSLGLVGIARSAGELAEALGEPLELEDVGRSESYRGYVREVLEAFGERELGFPAYADVQIKEELCTLCEACARYCPTGALRIERGESVVLRLVRDECIGCSKCQWVCPENAIEKVPWRFSTPYERVLVSSPIARCERCGRELEAERLIASVERRLRAAGAVVALKNLRLCPNCKAESILD
ncbi:MAG: 4Fe-4S binding protein [Acidilobaceae archaeon]|nr:4Fe-4S binding protein [Acidilobaceae archaeon]MCX8165201.1 4Fe-4S binding protein [Acidilobaceae archaeon]MDW7974283.1 4Fe-4S binding protein [Sulfolobales archaeon]